MAQKKRNQKTKSYSRSTRKSSARSKVIFAAIIASFFVGIVALFILDNSGKLWPKKKLINFFITDKNALIDDDASIYKVKSKREKNLDSESVLRNNKHDKYDRETKTPDYDNNDRDYLNKLLRDRQ